MKPNYAHHGEAEGALQIFERMLKEGMKPNYVTFVGLLSACVHAGFVELGLHYFETMPTFGVEPGIEHYACVVSLLGHVGKLDEAKALIESLPIKPAAVLWRSLLSSCRIAGNVELGKYAAEMAISIDPMDSELMCGDKAGKTSQSFTLCYQGYFAFPASQLKPYLDAVGVA
ncbi:hypothetical protein V6N12_015166 [Hibiscus sabdariffa]|uniref:Pentatricopeptide repeat-containing protein n=1 Tax=Hibiscus sabdariffa TaxID=183260 RepID=A0ABR2DMF5_9ROSI